MPLILISFFIWLICIIIYLAIFPSGLNLSVAFSMLVSLLLLVVHITPMAMPLEISMTMAMNTLYRKTVLPFITIGLLCTVMVFLYSPTIFSLHILSLAAGIGMAISLFMSEDLRKMVNTNDSERGGNPIVEKRRDVAQIISGILFILIFPLLIPLYTYDGMVGVALISMITLTIVSLTGKNVISRLILSLERKNVPVGIGSLWYISGILILMGMNLSTSVILLGIFAMAIGDSLATIVGVSIKTMKLPYSRKKSIGGLASMLIPTAIFGYILLGIYGSLIGIIASIVESFSGNPVDDNFSIPMGTSLMALLLGLA